MRKFHFGLIAKDIQNSVTPIVYDAFAHDIGVCHSFEILNVPEDKLETTLNYAREHLDGFNVTMPYKQTALKYMDALDDSARKCGSTNTVLVENGKLIGYNTDGWGLIRALQDHGVQLSGKRVVMLGAGGVASSIAYHLSTCGVRETAVVNLYYQQAQELCEKFGPSFTPHLLEPGCLERLCAGADLFINASVMGQIGYDDFDNLDFLDTLASGGVVFDVNYSNPEAKLVPGAIAKGIPAWKGRAMTACQGIRAISIWTGKEPSREAAAKLVEKLEAM